MELSIFLAKLFGIYLMLMAFLWAVRGEMISRTLAELFENGPLLLLSGLISLAVGIAMTISHTVWEWNWRGLLTLFGYVAILKGLVRIGFPEAPREMIRRLTRGKVRWIWICLALVLGAWLTWAGFSVDAR